MKRGKALTALLLAGALTFGSATAALAGPSGETAVDGLIAPVITTGLSVFTVRLRKNAVSSMVSVP